MKWIPRVACCTLDRVGCDCDELKRWLLDSFLFQWSPANCFMHQIFKEAAMERSKSRRTYNLCYFKIDQQPTTLHIKKGIHKSPSWKLIVSMRKSSSIYFISQKQPLDEKILLFCQKWVSIREFLVVDRNQEKVVKSFLCCMVLEIEGYLDVVQ